MPSSKTTNKTTAILDADHTYGHYACELGVQKAIKMASKNGSGFVVIKNSTHNSAGAFYSLQPANKGMIGISFAHSTQGMIPTNSKEKFFGTNAFSISFPSVVLIGIFCKLGSLDASLPVFVAANRNEV